MKQKKWMLILLLGASPGVFAEDDSPSKQIQMLNSQIQSQLQQIQETQKKQISDLNKQLQAQLKKVQMDIQQQINEGYSKTQDQIKTVQDNLQKQIKQVSLDVTKAGTAK